MFLLLGFDCVVCGVDVDVDDVVDGEESFLSGWCWSRAFL